MKKCTIIFIQFLLGFVAESKGIDPPQLIVKTHVYKDRVAIRWTPSSLYLWRKWSESGYRLERQCIGKNGLPVDSNENVILGSGSIKPLSAYDSILIIDSIPEFGLIQQCLNRDRRNSLSSKNDYLEALEVENQCYIFSMLAMQSNFSLAIAGGIGFIDSTIKDDEVYLYKLYPLDTNEFDAIEFIVDMLEETVLPVLTPLKVNVKENTITLRWDAKKYNSIYFGFNFEKSLDSGITYTSVNDVPYIPVHMEEQVLSLEEIFSDTISQFLKPILYRIRGLSYFGQYSNPSESVSVTCLPETEMFPKFLEVNDDSFNTSTINWQFDSESEKLIIGFKILQADSINGDFIDMDTNLLPVNSRHFNFITNKSVAYIKIAAVTLNNNLNFSLPVLVQKIDTIAPLAPQGVSLVIDTNSIAMLNWSKNKEKDFMAYKVFKGNHRNLEFSSITPGYYLDTFFVDTLFNGMIRDSIYYKLIAFDQRYNESSFSKIFAVAIPNKIPPSPPVIYSFNTDGAKVFFKWHKSNSKYVVEYHLLRKELLSGDVIEFFVNDSIYQFTDSTVQQGTTYFYSLVAKNGRGLISKSARPIEVNVPDLKIMPPVSIEKVFCDSLKHSISLYWKYEYDEEVSHYRIVKALPGGGIQTVGTAIAGSYFHTYYYIKPYTMTNYFIIAYFKDGRRSRI